MVTILYPSLDSCTDKSFNSTAVPSILTAEYFSFSFHGML